MLNKMYYVRNNLNYAKNSLSYALDNLYYFTNINGSTFKRGTLVKINNRIDTQVYYLNYKIIPAVRKM